MHSAWHQRGNRRGLQFGAERTLLESLISGVTAYDETLLLGPERWRVLDILSSQYTARNDIQPESRTTLEDSGSSRPQSNSQTTLRGDRGDKIQSEDPTSLMDLKKNEETHSVHDRNADWDPVWDEFIWSYVKECPINLWDTKRQRNISRPELKDDIAAALKVWMKIPLTCSKLVETLLHAEHEWGTNICTRVTKAMAKTPVTDPVDHFISTLTGELKFVAASTKEAVRALIGRKRVQSSIPTLREVKEQIQFFGMYAILSHCWGEEEVSFTEMECFHSEFVRSQKGFQKLVGFAKTAESHYGCRYIWMDTVCISDEERDRSIPLMFGWYRHAYVCIIYFTTNCADDLSDPWFTRGWTLQEFLAARRLAVFTSDNKGAWHMAAHVPSNNVFDVVEWRVLFTTLSLYTLWARYKPGLKSIVPLFQLMAGRRTKRPEDMVYCLLSALDVDIPIRYGEGFDSAFFRLQAYCLSKDRQCLLWDSTPNRLTSSTPRNSMLATNFQAYKGIDDYHICKPTGSLPDPSISFDEDDLMHIMVSFLSWQSFPMDHPQRQSELCRSGLLFASLHMDCDGKHYGVLLRRVPDERIRNLKSYRIGEAIGIPRRLKVVYERVSLKAFSTWELAGRLEEPEWVYIM